MNYATHPCSHAKAISRAPPLFPPFQLGTYAIAFPLAMPLAWAIAEGQGLAHPEFFMTICFAAVMDGSVYGDQCSPISDTTVLSSMCTGCDLMDHVTTQIPQASVAALLAAIGWTACVLIFA